METSLQRIISGLELPARSGHRALAPCWVSSWWMVIASLRPVWLGAGRQRCSRAIQHGAVKHQLKPEVGGLWGVERRELYPHRSNSFLFIICFSAVLHSNRPAITEALCLSLNGTVDSLRLSYRIWPVTLVALKSTLRFRGKITNKFRGDFHQFD